MTFIFISMWKIRLNRIGNLGIGTASIERCRHVESGFHFLLLIFIPVVGGLDLLLSNEWLGVYLFIHLFSCRWNRRSWNRLGWFLFCNLFRSVDNQSTFLSLSLSLSYCCCLGLFRCISIFFTGNNRNNRVETTVKVAASTWRPQLRRVNEPMACLSESHILFDHFDP